MVLDRASLKIGSKSLLKTARVSPYWFVLLAVIISEIINGINYYVRMDDVLAYVYSQQYGVDLSFLALHREFPSWVVLFITIVCSLLLEVLSAGVWLYHLGIRRGEEMPYTTLFDGFSMAGKVIALAVVQYLYVLLWSLLFVIPGIVAAYRYRFAILNLCENPEMSVMDAIRMSKAQTYGFKWQLFVLDMSFIGWNILEVLTLGVLQIWVRPYLNQTNVAFFQEIKRVKGIGFVPPREEDGQFRPHDPFDPTDNMGM